MRKRTGSAYDVTRMVLGLLLLVAAGLKAHQLATEPVPETSLLTSRWFLIIWVETEIVLGLWFLTGLARRAAWGAALACFSVFSLVTLYKALSGDVSCGCFGRVEGTRSFSSRHANTGSCNHQPGQVRCGCCGRLRCGDRCRSGRGPLHPRHALGRRSDRWREARPRPEHAPT